MWVMSAITPLNSNQLLRAIRLDFDGDTGRLLEEVDEDHLLRLCRNLLVLDSQRKVWRLSHLSVVEYFEKHHWNLRQAHLHAAKVCLKTLLETFKEQNSISGTYYSADEGDESDESDESDETKKPAIFNLGTHFYDIRAGTGWSISRPKKDKRMTLG